MIRLTILGISIFCFPLCQDLSSALSHDQEDVHHFVLKSSKTALPTNEAIVPCRKDFKSGLHGKKGVKWSIKVEDCGLTEVAKNMYEVSYI